MPKITLKDCQDYAKSKGGVCLSTEYINGTTPMDWKCKKGDKWSSRFTTMKADNSWCPYCSGRRNNNLEVCKRVAEERGGKCLSTTYKNNKTPMEWECKYGHTWKNKLDSIKNDKHWCPDCSSTAKLTLEHCIQHAEAKGGKCLSTEYINDDTHMEWECKEGHKWSANFHNMRNKDAWCPRCNLFRSENMSIEALEKCSGEKFPKVKPRFLNGLELDGYNEDLHIALEYQGEQHYKYSKFFHGTKERFEKQLERDKKKKEILSNHNIDLIEIPYTYDFTDPDALKAFVEKEYFKILIKRRMSFNHGDLNVLEYKGNNIIFKCAACKETDVCFIPHFNEALDNHYPKFCIFDSCSNY